MSTASQSLLLFPTQMQMNVKARSFSPPLLSFPRSFAERVQSYAPFPHTIHFPQLPKLSSIRCLRAFSMFNKNPAFPETLRRASVSSGPATSSQDTEREKEKLAQVTRRLENTGRYFKRLGGLGFWSQLVCTVVSAVILAFSVVITGSPTSPTTFYLTAAGIAAAFLSVFWSFGYIRLSEQLRKYASDPTKAPTRGDVVKRLKTGIVINIAGMCATVLGMQATVGVLVAKALTSSATPYYQGLSPGYSPVLALDVFLVQACGNTMLSHFLGLVFSLELLRSVTLPLPSETLKPKLA
eukprot:TRINITY_DN19691_c0_g1_i2.p1 TRINITY_DN19691_c0_g1~~TRINITY_DN19691_c0_g1_i2.p1  ORF type:complete len:296 (+),score=19.36 TRINITY_DN19691_c0_g1_i2:216-1103(+)